MKSMLIDCYHGLTIVILVNIDPMNALHDKEHIQVHKMIDNNGFWTMKWKLLGELIFLNRIFG